MTHHIAPTAPWRCCLLAATLGACTGAVPRPTTADARRVGAPLSELAEGRRIYVRKCSGCHALVPPAKRSATAWRDKLGVMSARARLDATSRERLTAYLAAFARKPRPGGGPELTRR